MNFDAMTQEHTRQWKSFTRLLTTGTVLVASILVLMGLFLL
ncbi:MAG: aa3-type cytochrome c oxidase subunit IV [Alphaproteobacteria bacterium]